MKPNLVKSPTAPVLIEEVEVMMPSKKRGWYGELRDIENQKAESTAADVFMKDESVADTELMDRLGPAVKKQYEHKKAIEDELRKINANL